MSPRPILVAVLAAVLASCTMPPPETAYGSRGWADECSALPGFAAFRAELERAVTARDEAAFDALFHPEGAMRVNGVGGHNRARPWNLSEMEASGVWKVLDEMLPLGCVERDGHVFLPAMYGMVEDGLVEPEYDMAIADLAVHARPDDSAPVQRHFRTGELIRTVSYDDDWIEVLVDGHRQGFVRADQLRSPHGFQMQLIEEGGRWYIREFGGGV